MALDLKKITRDFYAELHRAYASKELHPARLHLDDEVKMIGNDEVFQGKKVVISILENFIHLIKKVDIQHQYFDHNSCCTFLIATTIIPDIQIRSAERLVVSYGHVVELNILFDLKAWQNLMGLLQNLNSSASFFQKIKK